MKIAVFTDTFHPQKNGVVVFLDQTLAEMSKMHKVVLFAPGTGRQRVESVGRNMRIYWMPSIPFPFYEGYRMARSTALEVNRILKDEKPDVVHLHSPVLLGLQGMIAARKRGLPTVATYHTHLPDYLPHLLRGRMSTLIGGIGDYTTKKLIKLVYSGAGLSTAPTRELVRELKSYGVRNAVCLPNGVNMKKLKASAADRKAFARKYGVPAGMRIVLYAGRVSFEKKLDVLLEAFRRIQDGRTLLLVVGSGPSLEGYRKMAGELGLKDAVFTGYVDERMLAAAYSLADIFVSPSDTETFGMTFVEAMSFGLPAIGANRLGAKELISDGRNGFLTEPGLPAGLAERMRRLLCDGKLRARMGRNAKKASMEYTTERCVARTLELYRGLIARNKKAKAGGRSAYAPIVRGIRRIYEKSVRRIDMER